MEEILIIDDDPLVRASLRSMLERHGFGVSDAGTGPAGWERIVLRPPDLVLCDIHLPGSSGLDLVAGLRADPRTALIPCIVMTGQPDLPTQRQGMESGADDFLQKPCTEGTLLAAVAARLRKHAAIRAQSERAVHDSEVRYRMLFESSADAITVLAPPDWRFLDANPAALRVFGIEHRSQFIGGAPADFSPEFQPDGRRSAEKAASLIKAALQAGSKSFTWTHYRRGGEAFPALVLLARVDLEGVAMLQATVRDISEQRHAESQLRMLSLAVEQSPASVVITDTAGRIEYVNPKFSALTGYGPEEVLGQNPRILKSGSTSAEGYRSLWETLLAGREWRGELHNRKKDGSLFWEFAVISPITDMEGRTTHYLAVKEDITERKRSERARDQMETQLRHAQKLESIGQLAAGIAHEINTPTQYIGDNTHFLREGFAEFTTLLQTYERLAVTARAGQVTPELLDRIDRDVKAVDTAFLLQEIPKAIAQSLEGVERVTRIVSAMKDFSHPGKEEKSPVDLGRAIQSALTVSRNEWKYVAEVVTDFDPSLPPVTCLLGEFNQVILNLVVNAAHAIADVVKDGTRGKGTITATTRRDGDWAEIRVADTGTGIPEHARGRIFDPFFTTKPVGKGTGQGLSIVHAAVVEKHGGSIRFETAMGRGTTFVIRLPVTPGTRPHERGVR